MTLTKEQKIDFFKWIIGGIALVLFFLWQQHCYLKPKSACQEMEVKIKQFESKLKQFRSDLNQLEIDKNRELKIIADSLKTFAEKKDLIKKYKELCLN